MLREASILHLVLVASCSGPTSAPPASSTAASAAPVASSTSRGVPVVTVDLPRAGKDSPDLPPVAPRPDDPRIPAANPDMYMTPTSVVRITATKTLEVNGQPTTLDDLRKSMQKQHEAAPETRVVIMADKSVAYGFVIEVMDAIKQAGIAKLAFGVEAPVAP